MKRNLQALLSLFVVLLFSAKSNAQSTIIDYWNFNSFFGVEYTDTIHGVDANYSTLDTTKAQILYAELPGTSSSFVTYVDYVAVSSTSPDYDTVNAQFGDSSGNALRPRNPSDSMQLLFYIPSTHYTHILLQYGSESSSVAHGMTHQNFSYSVDSGLTWRTSGLSELSDSAWLVFHRTSVSIATDSSVKNNDKLVFRIIFSGNTTGTSGNNRFDNVTVSGDTIVPSSVVIAATPAGAICAGASVHFTATATYSYVTPVYHWYVNGLSAGTDSTGFTTSSLISGSTVQCVITDSVDGSVLAHSNVFTETVTPAPAVSPISGLSNVCPTSSITLSDTASGGIWTASNTHAAVSTGGVVTGVSTGVDTITYHITNACGTASAAFVVSVSTTPSPGVISGPSTVCTGSSISLLESVSGGVWSASNTHAAVSDLGDVSGLTPGVDTIIYTITTCGVAHTTYTVSVSAPPSAGTISGPSTVCIDTASLFSETVSGGAWSLSNANASVSGTGSVTGLVSGNDTLIYTVATCATVEATYPITIITLPSAGVITGTDAVCIDSMTLVAETVTGGTWSTSNSDASVSSAGIVTGVSMGTDMISYSVSNACGTSVATQTIAVDTPTYAGVITGPDTVCIGHTITLTESVPGGLWAALNANASVTLTGDVTGITAGADTIGYAFLTPCISYTYQIVTVLPALACMSQVNTVNATEGMLRVYPNPANGAFTVYCASAGNGKVHVTINNIVGARVMDISIPANQPYEISLDQPSGIYLINAVTGEGSYSDKITLAH